MRPPPSSDPHSTTVIFRQFFPVGEGNFGSKNETSVGFSFPLFFSWANYRCVFFLGLFALQKPKASTQTTKKILFCRIFTRAGTTTFEHVFMPPGARAIVHCVHFFDFLPPVLKWDKPKIFLPPGEILAEHHCIHIKPSLVQCQSPPTHLPHAI